MLSPAEIVAVVTATKGLIDIFDKLAGPIERVILGQPRFEKAEDQDQRWRFRVETEGKNIVVKEGDHTWRKITGADLSKALGPNDLALVQAYEFKMQDYLAGSSLKCDTAQPVRCRPNGNPLLARNAG